MSFIRTLIFPNAIQIWDCKYIVVSLQTKFIMNHQSGFVSIIGKPNVGKSTLLNALIGEKISIISPKVQTTRHRIMGILSSEKYQIVFSDTPGIIEPRYKLQGSMMQFVNESLEDADVVLFITDMDERNHDADLLEKIKLIKTPLIVLINKIDLSQNEKVLLKIEELREKLGCETILPISALSKFNIGSIVQHILTHLKEAPSFFPDDQLTDKSERFIASEILREKIMMHYKEEIPYSVQVDITEFLDEPDIIRIMAEIYVMRDSQKQIMIGKGGIALRNTGTAARRDMENFFGKKVFLKTFVKVKEDWRDNDRMLKQFGYNNK
jgi:GTP-binding protein Era